MLTIVANESGGMQRYTRSVVDSNYACGVAVNQDASRFSQSSCYLLPAEVLLHYGEIPEVHYAVTVEVAERSAGFVHR